jgi:preprotein translocase subunit SecE
MPHYPDPRGESPPSESTARLRLEDAGRLGRTGRTTPFQYLRDVQGELSRVAWPSRAQLVSYSLVVLITLVIMVSMIFGLSIGFRDMANYLLTP